MSKEDRVTSHSPEETISIGYEFAKDLKANDVIGLFGNLGSGKTQFVKGVCKYFKVRDPVNSPTFIIVNQYNGEGENTGRNIKINHFDLYRLKNIGEFKEIGIDDYVNDDSICLIEWAELAEEYFKGDLRKVFFEHGGYEQERIINF